MNFIENYQKETIDKVNNIRQLPDFNVGDTIIVQTKIGSPSNQRVQAYQGVVLSRKNRGLASSFVVRKISHGEGVNKNFMYYSPNIVDIQIIRYGSVRRAKLYYISRLKGKAARVKEKIVKKFSKSSHK
ncbi:MAG: 50S ribosomal protein L19 [Rickettsia sp.]|nr:50S ribosomal protein L19 [Rickettsia sp.]